MPKILSQANYLYYTASHQWSILSTSSQINPTLSYPRAYSNIIPVSMLSHGGRIVCYTWHASIKSWKLLNLEFWSILVCYELIAIAINNRKGPSEWTFDIPKIENVNIQIGSFQFSWNFIWNSFYCHLLNFCSNVYTVYSLHQGFLDDQSGKHGDVIKFN